MLMWILFFLAGLVLLCIGVVYLSFQWAYLIPINKKWLARLSGFVINIIITAVLYFCIGPVNALVCMIHLFIFLLILNALRWLVKKRINVSKKLTGIIGILLCVTYLGIGWYMAHNVVVTNYRIDTNKEVGNIRVVQFADSHVGTTFNGKELAKYTRQMQALEPDVVLINGDFVDDSTSKQDMIDACKALSELHPKYGIYFSYGNHDRGYFNSRGYDEIDIERELIKNNVVILKDETVLIDNRFYIVGREDISEVLYGDGRLSIDELTTDLDNDKYTIVMDHQPRDYDNESKSKVDLVLSGHTHGGQLFPLELVTNIFNDRTYGYEKRDLTSFIVTSGISDWEVKFKTGTKAEFNLIEIK